MRHKKSEHNETQTSRERFVFHIDTTKPEITLQDFIDISKSLEVTCKSVSALVFDNAPCQIIIETPDDGSLKLIYTIAVMFGAALIPDITNGILEEYTNHDVKYYAGKASRAFTDCVSGIYSASMDKLKKTLRELPEENKDKLERIIKAQNDFYGTLNKTKEFKGVGFSDDYNFPVSRKEFSIHTTNDIERILPTEQALKHLVIYKSLNVNEDGKWEFKDKADGSHFSANIEDEFFKKQFLNGKNPLKKTKKDDEIIALVEYEKKIKNGSAIEQNRVIKEIYTFNNKELRKTPENLIMNLMKKKEDKQGDLFDD